MSVMIRFSRSARILAVALSVLIVLLSVPVTARAEQQWPVDSWASVQAALDEAGNGDTVYIPNYVGAITAGPNDAMLVLRGGKSVTLDLNGGTIDRNRASSDADGHVILVNAGCTLTIVDSSGDNSGTVTGGWATNGGAINNQGTLVIRGGTFSGNKATNGGAICNRGTLVIEGGVFCDNTASGNGGAIWSEGSADIQFATITGNTASVNGGGIYLDSDGDSGASLVAYDVKINGNTAGDGGGLYLNYTDSQHYATATLEWAEIKENTTTVHGGGGITNYGDLTLDYSELEDNEAVGSGGGIYNGNQFSAAHTTIKGNASGNLGGGVCNYGTTLDVVSSISDCQIGYNTSKDGGGIYNHNDNDAGSNPCTVRISGDTDITNNTASQNGGGGIRNGNQLIVSGFLTVENNACAGNGGGLWDNGVTVIEGGTVIIRDNESQAGTPNMYQTSFGSGLGSSVSRLAVTGPISADSEIYVSSEALPSRIATVYGGGSVDGGVFMSDVDGYICTVKDNGVYLSEGVYYISRRWDGEKVADKRVEDAYVIAVNTLNANSDNVVVLNNNNVYYVPQDTLFTQRLEVSGSASIILTDGTTLTCQKGIRVAEGAVLNIYGQKNDTGTLIANADNLKAAIGSNDQDSGQEQGAGTIVIHGGTVTATGGSDAAGIGGGNEGFGGTVTIYGGTVTAQGGDYAAGIGGGDEDHGGSVTVYGGKVTATGGKYGAGIGTGDEANSAGSYSYTQYGGEVTATGGDEAAGVGGGNDTNGGTVTIWGGKLTAIGKDCHTNTGYEAGGAGIGGGDAGHGGTVTVYGGEVYAEGGDNAAGIGGGEGGNGGSVTINGGVVIAGCGNASDSKYDHDGAGIGGGQFGKTGTVIINGGDVTAVGGSGGAGIGTGNGDGWTNPNQTDSGSVTINGGTVNASGGFCGAGIGGGRESGGVTVTITDGTVTAHGGENAAGIGSGLGCGLNATITISGGTVNAYGHNENEFCGGAGIGTSKTGGNDNNGTGKIVISGGSVNAYGARGAAGIGGGYEAPAETIEISGGTVLAVSAETSNTAAPGIGAGAERDEDYGSVTITGGTITATSSGPAGGNDTYAIGIGSGGDAGELAADFLKIQSNALCVTKNGNSTPVSADDRTASCMMGTKTAIIAPCEHLPERYDVTDTEHTQYCTYCKTTFPSEAHAFDEEGICTVCNYGLKYTVTFDANGGGGSMQSGNIFANRTYILPECGFTAPAGMKFKEWAVIKTGESAPAAMQPGDPVVMTADVTVTAIWGDLHTISVLASVKCSVELSADEAVAGEQITITVIPDDGCLVQYFEILNADTEESLPYTQLSENTYTFVMTDTAASVVVTCRNEEVFDPYDVNRDGLVDIVDVTELLNVLSGHGSADLSVCDLNGDSNVDISDVTPLLNALAGN